MSGTASDRARAYRRENFEFVLGAVIFGLFLLGVAIAIFATQAGSFATASGVLCSGSAFFLFSIGAVRYWIVDLTTDQSLVERLDSRAGTGNTGSTNAQTGADPESR